MPVRAFINPTEAPINARAATPVLQNSVADIDVLDSELAAALNAGLIIAPSRKASLTTALGSNKDITLVSKKEGPYGNPIRLIVAVAGGSVARSISVNVGTTTTDITVNLATTTGTPQASETATNIAAAINADAAAGNLVTASVAVTQTGAGVMGAVSATALTAAAHDHGRMRNAGRRLAHA